MMDRLDNLEKRVEIGTSGTSSLQIHTKSRAMYRQFLEPHLIDPEPPNDDYQIEVARNDKIKDSGSLFRCFTVTVNSLSDVTAMIQEVMTMSRCQYFQTSYLCIRTTRTTRFFIQTMAMAYD